MFFVRDIVCPICHDPLIFDPIIASDGVIYNNICFHKIINNKQIVKSPTKGVLIDKKTIKTNIIKNIAIDLIFNSNILDDTMNDLSAFNVLSYDMYQDLILTGKLNVKEIEEEKKDFMMKKIYESINICSSLIDIDDENCCKINREYEIIGMIRNNLLRNDHKKINLNYADSDGNNLLIYSCIMNLHHLTRYLLSDEIIFKNIDQQSDQKIDQQLDQKNFKQLSFDIDRCNDNQMNALMLACGRPMPLIAHRLLDFGANCNMLYKGGSILTMAIYSLEKFSDKMKNKLFNSVQNLVCRMIDIPNINYNHKEIETLDTALILACKTKMTKVALKLLEKPDIEYNCVDIDFNTALIVACENNLTDVAMKLLEKQDIDSNAVNVNGITALMWSCQNSMRSVVEKLIEISSYNYVSPSNITAFSLICCSPLLSDIALKLLQQNLVDYKIINNVNHTILMLAIAHKNAIVAKALIEKYISCAINDGVVESGKKLYNHKDSNGLSALICSILGNESEIAIKLLEIEDIDLHLENDYTLLMMAVENKMTEVAIKLLGLDFDCLKQNEFGDSALTIAFDNGLTDVVVKMLKKTNVLVNDSEITSLDELSQRVLTQSVASLNQPVAPLTQTVTPLN